jgi:trehalose 6-phosphate phosphatase
MVAGLALSDMRQPDITPPTPRPDWALFLDIDGTLIDIAPTPDAVEVPETLAPALAAANAWLGGALAIVSGRSLAEIDWLMAPLRLPCVGEHGAVIRYPDGAVDRADVSRAVPAAWRARLRDATDDWTGVLVEEKAFSVAVHYRLAPPREGQIRALVDALAAENTADFEVLPASMAFEIRHRGLTKALAVEAFMAQPPFAGRVPVFVGDDVTDEDGFRAARAMGGLGLHVKQVFSGQPSEVRRWLSAFTPSPSL